MLKCFLSAVPSILSLIFTLFSSPSFSLAYIGFCTLFVFHPFSHSPSLFLSLCMSYFVLCLLMWNLVGDVFLGPGLKGFLSDPPQLVALPYFLFCSCFSLSLYFPVFISIPVLPFPV